MKNYDLSKYILQKDTLLIFPLTKDEVAMLMTGADKFSEYIRIPYLAKEHDDTFLNKVLQNIDMENDYWFLDSIWMCTDIKAKAIVGTVKLEKVDQFNKIVMQVNEDSCVSVTSDDVLNLFYRFLAGNGFVNIVVQTLNEVSYENK